MFLNKQEALITEARVVESPSRDGEEEGILPIQF
jgi:hypothetical protein